jgi:hypothetical protein
MSDLADDGSMAGIKMPWSTGDNNKAALLHKLQKSVHFVKTIASSHMPYVDNPVCALVCLCKSPFPSLGAYD